MRSSFSAALIGSIATTVAGACYSDDYLNLSLEQLVQLPISVASSKLDEQSWSPSVVSRYSRSQLQSLGITDLPALLRCSSRS